MQNFNVQIKQIQIQNNIQNSYLYNFKKKDRILALIACLLTFPVVIFCFYNIQNGVWFNTLQFLTDQSNLMCWTFLLLYAFLHKQRNIFNGNKLQIVVVSYITFVFICFNCILLPSYIQNAEFNSPYLWTSTVWFHMFAPIVNILFAIFVMRYVKRTYIAKYKTVGYGMLYVLYQFIYFTCLPFLSLMYRINTVKNNYNYLQLSSFNNHIIGACEPLTFNGNGFNGHNIIQVSNQILSHFNGAKKINLANSMINNWFTVNHVSFVKYLNNKLLIIKMPNTTQLAHIYYNMGINYDAIRNVSANNLVYFNHELFSTYGTVTNLNPNVNIYEIRNINNNQVLNQLYDSLTSNKFNSLQSINLYADHPGSYYVFILIFGSALLYLTLLSFWWLINRICQKKLLKQTINK